MIHEILQDFQRNALSRFAEAQKQQNNSCQSAHFLIICLHRNALARAPARTHALLCCVVKQCILINAHQQNSDIDVLKLIQYTQVEHIK